MNKKFFVKLLAFFSLLLLTLTTFADKGFKITGETSSSVKLSWDKDEKASYYQISYGEEPSSGRKNSLETEAVDGTEYEIKGLDLSKKYYFTLIGLDSAGNEVFKSKDLEKTSSKFSSTFALVSTSLKEKNLLRLTFSKNLDLSKLPQADFMVESLDGTKTLLNVIDVKKVDGDNKSIDLVFETETLEGVDYKLVILAIFDESGDNIKFGVDSEVKFKGGELNKVNSVEVENDLNSAGPVEEPVEVEVKREEIVEKKEEIKKEVKEVEVGKNVESMSKKKEDLPKTGPEMILLLILALLIPAGVLFLKNKNS